MSWMRDNQISWLQSFVARILKCGPIPQHVAFIMDGNRRFAKKKSIARADGHLLGFDALAQTLNWCQEIGVKEVTIYAFSIENFKRSQEEVEGLMELARQKLTRLVDEREKLAQHGLCVRVVGNLTLLPGDIQHIIAQVVEHTKHNNKCFVNICISYTSREEISSAMREAVEGVQMGLLRQTDISENLLQQCLYTNQSMNPDLLVRTSGEVRLSDFLLWQSTFSVLSFMTVLWPEFSFWDLCKSVLHYQTQHKTAQDARQVNADIVTRLERESDESCVLADSQAECFNGTPMESRTRQYALERRERIADFLKHLHAKRSTYISQLYQTNTLVEP